MAHTFGQKTRFTVQEAFRPPDATRQQIVNVAGVEIGAFRISLEYDESTGAEILIVSTAVGEGLDIRPVATNCIGVQVRHDEIK